MHPKSPNVPHFFPLIEDPSDCAPSSIIGILLSEVLSEKQKQICIDFYGLNKSNIFYDGREDEMTQYNKDMTKRKTNPWWYFFTDEYIAVSYTHLTLPTICSV